MASIPNLPKISLSRNQIIMIAGGLALILIVFVLFKFLGSKKPAGDPVVLAVWGTDSPAAFKDIISGYITLRPNVTVNYTQVPEVGYEEEIVKALASGKGPDVFLVENHDLLSRGDLLSPAPETQVPVATVQSAFPQAVIQDFVYDNQVYALPLYMDTLALAYNRQMFDQAGVVAPPATWQEIIDLVPRLRVLDLNGQLTRAALPLGGSEKSVVHGTDILNMIMLQNGVAMSNDLGAASFASDKRGLAALQFYLQFADAGSPAYTWNDLAGNSLESFASQKSAMVLLYHRDLAAVKKQAPFLDFGVAPAPQISADLAVNYPSYRGLGVWVGSKAPAWAWDFILFASTNSAAQGGYLTATGHPAALRSIIATQQNDLNLWVFAQAALTARSWKMGDYDKIRTIFNTAIQNVQSGAKTAAQALVDAQTQANQLVPK